MEAILIATAIIINRPTSMPRQITTNSHLRTVTAPKPGITGRAIVTNHQHKILTADPRRSKSALNKAMNPFQEPNKAMNP